MIVRSLFVLFSLFIALGSADAHGPERGPNGGQVQDLGGNHVELVMQGQEIVVYLFDAQNAPIAAEGVVATATVLTSGAQPKTVPLQPAGANVLRGRGELVEQPGLKVVVSLTLPGQRPQIGRYALIE